MLVSPKYEGWSASCAAWAPDGRTVYYSAVDEASGRVSLWSVPSVGGTPTMRVLFDDPARTPSRLDFATDGRRFYYTLAEHQSDIWVLRLGRDRGARRDR